MSKDMKKLREEAIGEVFQAKDTAHSKARRRDRAWSIGGKARRPVCLEQSERGEREQVRAGKGREGCARPFQ